MRKSIIFFSLLSLLASLAITSCSTSPTSQPKGPETLKIALIPVLDGLPIYVANQEGLFKAHGVNVEIIPVASAPERDQLISSGQADGMINEALSTMFYNKDQVRVQIVRYARAASSDSAVFRILASAKSGITSVDGLKGVEVGSSQGTVIEYLISRLLAAEGFKPAEIKTISVPKIADRMTLLGSGELKAAMLPDPMSSLAVQNGAKVILEDSRHPEYSFSTIAFRKPVLDEHPEAVRAFLAAIEEAVVKINANPTGWNSLLSDQKLVPAPLMGTFQVPKFVMSGVPTQAQWDDTLAWAKEQGLLSKNLLYKDSVTADYLPKK
jgi:NitT/TauT family transport system substrate-binding protein